jgi:hypothetical protein
MGTTVLSGQGSTLAESMQEIHFPEGIVLAASRPKAIAHLGGR